MVARTRLIVSTLAGAFIGVAIAAGLAVLWISSRQGDSALHEKLHQAVPLNTHEKAVLDAKERAFAARRAEIEGRMRAANAHLADAIAANPSWSPQVETATREVEQAAADLQRATLVHVFEMRDGLLPEHRPAYDKVLVDALRRGSR